MKPVDPDALRRRRQHLVADRVFRWTYAVVGDDELVSTRRWWSLSELFEFPQAYGFDWGWNRAQTLERFYQEFLAALEAGTFDAAGKTRVALLDWTLFIEPTTPWPQLRLTFQRAQTLIDTSHRTPYRRLGDAWIEIDRAYKWLSTWVNPQTIRRWSQLPPIAQSLQAAAQHNARRPAARTGGVTGPLSMPHTTAPPSAVVDVPLLPGTPKLQVAVREALSTVGWPGSDLPWKRFLGHVWERCDANPTTRGYGERTIRRIVKAIGES